LGFILHGERGEFTNDVLETAVGSETSSVKTLKNEKERSFHREKSKIKNGGKCHRKDVSEM
jgi:hypothetical protein